MSKKDIEPKLKLIREYLDLDKEEVFIIPAYQRAYSWGIAQCDKLWQDIEDYIETGAADPYFFGTVIADCSNDNELRLIDGQQRTTTFLLLFKALQLRLHEIDYSYKSDETARLLDGLRRKHDDLIGILYKSSYQDIGEILHDWSKVKNISILKNESINEQYKDELQKIINAETFEEAEFNAYKLPRRQKDNKYTNFFRNFKFFYERLGNFPETKLDVFADTLLTKCQVIEIRSWQIEQAITMFNSLNSTGLPLSDADIISAQLYSNTKDREDFNRRWSDIIALASKLEATKTSNIDSILQQYMYILRAKTKEYINNSGSADVATPALRKYYLENNNKILDNPSVLCDSLSKIARIWDKIKLYPSVKLASKFNENIKIYLVSYLFNYEIDNIDRQTVTNICETLIRLFAILELVDIGYSSAKFKSFLFLENTKITNGYPLSQIDIDIREHIHKSWSQSDLLASATEYTGNSLVFLNEYLYAKDNGLDFDFEDNVNIEHIMPASGHNIEIIRQDANIETREEFDTVVNQLGNKILLEENINKSIGKEWFKTKKQTSIEAKSGYKDSKYNLAQALISFPNEIWTKSDIESATKKAADRIIKFIFA